MGRVRLALLSALAGSLLLPRIAACQDSPPPHGALELQLGIAGITLPEESDGLYSASPELRVGWFLRQSLEIQAQGDIRIWPLGGVAAKSYGGSGNLLWFPSLGSDHHDLYLLAGVGGAYNDPPAADQGSSFDPLVRAGIGVKAPLAGLSESLRSLYLNAEYRGEVVFKEQTNFVSGISVGVSSFR